MNNFTVIDLVACYIYSAMPIIILIVFLIGIAIRKKNPFIWEIEEYPHVDTRLQSIYWNVDQTGMGVFIFIGLFLGFPCLFKVSVFFEHYVEGMIESLEIATDILMGLTTFAFTMAGAIWVIVKKYYLVFSIHDVLKEYNFAYWLKQTIISCLCVCVLTMTLLDKKIETSFDCIRIVLFEEFVIYNLLCVIVIFYIVWSIMFSNKKIDLKLLKKFYRVHELGNIDYSQMKKGDEWLKEDIEINLGYLFDEYKKQCKKIRTDKIRKINFIFPIKTKRELWNKQARRKYWKLCICFVLMGIMVSVTLYTPHDIKIVDYMKIHLIIAVIDFLLPLLPIKYVRETFFGVLWEKWGFHFETNRELFVTCSSLQLRNRKYIQYMRSFCSLTGFVKVAYHMGVDTNEIHNILKKEIADLGESCKDSIGMFPVFIIGYIQYRNGQKIKYIKKAFHKMQMSEKKIRKFKEMFQNFTLYMDKADVDRKIEKKYIEWLCG